MEAFDPGQLALSGPENPEPEHASMADIGLAPETMLDFLSRRALEESRLAQQARSPQAAAAHRYLAAAYSAKMAKEIAASAALEELLRRIP